MTSPLEAIRRLNAWEQVPRDVVALYRDMAGVALKAAQALDADCGPAVRVFMHAENRDVYIHDPALAGLDGDAGLDKLAACERRLPDRRVAYSADPPFDTAYVLIKNAAFLGPDGPGRRPAAPLASPGVLGRSIVGGLLGSGLGYGGGPARPGDYAASPAAAPDFDLGFELGGEVKAAYESSTGAIYMPTIPVDAFNRAVWNDVHRAPNPWGDRDALGDGDAPLRTPPPVAAAVSGIVSGAGAARDATHVSAWDVAVTAGITAGKGYLGGLVLGRTLGALAGLRPETQAKLQDAGLWGGLIAGAANALFNG